MPSKFINQSKTIIYRITCKTKNVSDAYISYTTNLTQRKYKHERDSLDMSLKTPLYDSIRNNGGWNNWTCDILEKCVCNNDSVCKERMDYYISKYNPNLNDENLPDVQADDKEDGKYTCQCKKTYTHRSSYYKHTTTCLQYQHRHKNDISMNSLTMSITTTTTVAAMITQKQPDDSSEFVITSESAVIESDDNIAIVRHRFKPRKIASKVVENEVFHYSDESVFEPEVEPLMLINDSDHSDRESEHSDHEESGRVTERTNVSDIINKQNDKLRDYIRKMISALSGGNGKKRNKKSILNSLVFELLDQNKTLQKQLVELSKERNIIVNNTNNNQFNLNFFLNEQCKNAVNFSDFVDSIEITMDDLAYTRNQGLVEGISKVMIDALKQLDLYARPIHCTDPKRDIIYLHDEKQWARDEGNVRIRKAFLDIANKEYFAIKKWMDLHPGWETNTRLQEFHHKMLRNVLHEIKDDPIGERKIMKSVAREVLIEK